MLRFGFATCVRLGLSCMEAIYAVGGKLALAVTLRDELAQTKSGRVYLDEFCSTKDIPLAKIRNINDPECVATIDAADLDWLFIIGWSQIARTEVLSVPRRGVLGMHPTLLPIGRGRAAVPWAIVHGLRETGVTLFKLDEGVDTGPIAAQERIPIADRENATSLYERVDRAHVALLKRHWAALEADRLQFQVQDETQASVWPGRKPDDGRLTREMSLAAAETMIRAVTRPYPGAFIDQDGTRVRIWASGRPLEDMGAVNGSGHPTRRIHFCDGWVDAIDWVTEPLHTPDHRTIERTDSQNG